jgi:hypothetical protein
VRTCLNRLKSTGEITDRATNKFRVITICKYGDYQDFERKGNSQTNRQTNSQPTGKQHPTNIIQQNNNITSDNNNNDSMNDLELMFEDFRKAYRGTKRGFKLEFENLKKKRPKDWREVVPKLMPALEKLIEWREGAQSAGKFVPEWAMLQTWINQSRWESEFETIKKDNDGSSNIGANNAKNGAGTPNYDEEF